MRSLLADGGRRRVAVALAVALGACLSSAAPGVFAEERGATIETGDASATAATETDLGVKTATAGETRVVSIEEATTTTIVEAEARTGGNMASSTAGAAVATGDAYASGMAINVINTNIVDSAGLLYFADFFSSLGVDLRGLDLSYFDTPASRLCHEGPCGALEVAATAAATTTSVVTAVAATGGNAATSTDGTAAIATGDAYASGNAVTIVNSNIVQSNYLLIGVNGFADLLGDITLPGAAFFERLLSHDAVADDVRVTADSATVVTDETSAVAATGGNAATSTDGTAAIATGEAVASATSLTEAGTTQAGGARLFFLFRIWGGWQGTVHGLPDGMAWRSTPAGIVLTNEDGSPGSLEDLAGDTSVKAESAAAVTNAVSVYALTGDNEAEGADASVSTGDAYAVANSVNIVNTNLIGTNWIYAIFNIFGDFSGDISFGHPDLWLGAAAEAGNPALPGSPVTLRFTIANRGDADATGVALALDHLLGMLDLEGGGTDPDERVFDLGTIPAGATREFTVAGSAGFLPVGSSVAVPLTATVSETETDEDARDNADHLTIVISNPAAVGDGPSFTSDPAFEIEHGTDATATTSPATIAYQVAAYNAGGPSFGTIATHVLTDPAGVELARESWDLGTVGYDEEIDITYAAAFGKDVLPGSYTDTFTIAGVKHYPYGPGSVAYAPLESRRVVALMPRPRASAPLCDAYLTTYLAPGADNDAETVKKLQRFLRESEGEAALAVSGVYDAPTVAAVKRFQQKYRADVLVPWGYAKPTGAVYLTTAKKINDIRCSGRRSFGLSEDARAEIASTRAQIAALRAAAGVPAPAPVGHFAESAAATTTEDAPADDIDLPDGIEVGQSAPSTKGSWFARLLRAEGSLVAGALGAVDAAMSAIALR